MALCVNQSGTWRNITTLCVNQSGTWRNIVTGCINQSGTWRRFKVPSAWPGGPALGSAACGGYVICGASNVGWIVSPYSAEVTRDWYSRDDAVTTAQQVSGCTGWFVPSVEQLQNPGYTCRTYWDYYSSATYWSSTQFVSSVACVVYFGDGSAALRANPNTFCVRAFRCVTY